MLGQVLTQLGEEKADATFLTAAVAAFQSEQQVVSREDDADGWAETQNSVAMTLKCLGVLQNDHDRLLQARAAALLALEVAPNEETYKHTLEQIDMAISNAKSRAADHLT